MYIPGFLAGALSVIILEAIAFIAVVIYAVIKAARKNEEE